MNKNLTALILIILAVGTYFTVTAGMWADAQAVKATNDQYASALAHAAQLVSVRDEVLKQYNAISEADRTRLDKMIPSTVDNIRLVIDLNSLALRHGFSLSGLKAAASSDSIKNAGDAQSSTDSSIASPTLDTVSVSFSAQASYDQFIAFMQDLEADLRIMDLVHLSVSTGDRGQYNFQAQFQTYWLRQ